MLGAGVGLATGLVVALFPFAAIGGGLDAGQAGLVVVGVSDMGAKIEAAMKKANKVEAKSMEADTAALEADATTAQSESAVTAAVVVAPPTVQMAVLSVATLA